MTCVCPRRFFWQVVRMPWIPLAEIMAACSSDLGNHRSRCHAGAGAATTTATAACTAAADSFNLSFLVHSKLRNLPEMKF